MNNHIVIKKQWFVSSKTEDILNHYSFNKEIGSGAYGKVFVATELTTGITRAVKAIQKNRVSDYTSFQNEFEILSHLDHPNIVNIIETFETDRLCFLVLEYCSGGELFDRIATKRYLTEYEAAAIMKVLFSAVAYCHDHGVCHRDIKPENCLFANESPESDIKLIDFGLSKVFDENEMMHTLNGTPYYIAPEVLSGNYTYQVDCWSLGVILYIMLSGSPPFNGRNNQEILMNVFNGYYNFRNRAFDNVSEAAKDLISKLLVKDANFRLTAKEALKHPWITGLAPSQQISLPTSVFDGLRSFAQARNLKRASLIYIASKLSEKDLQSLREMFNSLDSDGDGSITIEELHSALSSSGRSFDISAIATLCEMLDSNNNGKIDYTEWIAACMQNQKYLNTGLLKSAFQHFDVDGNGKITKEELRNVLTGGDLGLNLPQRDVEAMISEADRDRDGAIDYMEFINMMAHRS
ncbi:unnamed protein product [Blepharisma stoltei]|uniref:non-specific serine/threonine protein kinase n=1 Tax=Blepharisma stoltei TaxID=1481888 RepID=A0AAU9IPZ7_9CILI|nr:unnamed protein product [Blepharisma stoltei]